MTRAIHFHDGASRTRGRIYVLRSGDRDFFKIGRSDQLNQRLNQMQAGNPDTLHVIAILDTQDYMNLEKQFHKHLVSKHFRREWFHLSLDEMKEAIRHIVEHTGADYCDYTENARAGFNYRMATHRSIHAVLEGPILNGNATYLGTGFSCACGRPIDLELGVKTIDPVTCRTCLIILGKDR